MSHAFKALCYSVVVIVVLQACKLQHIKPEEHFDYDRFQAITLDYGDTLVKFNITENPEDIKTDLSKEYYWFKVDKIDHTQGSYIGKRLDGDYEVINQKDKSVVRKGQFTEGLKSGQWLSWYTNGKLESAYEYKEGVKTGDFLLQNKNGKPTLQGTYADDALDGKITYYRADTVYQVLRYKMGVPVDTIQ